MLSINKKLITLDLHGKFLAEAQIATIDFLKEAIAQKLTKIIIITGRGSHPNLNGRRGLIFKSLPNWLLDDAIKPWISSIERDIGAYKIHLNKKADNFYRINNPHLALENENDFDPTKLMEIIQSKESFDVKCSILDKLLNSSPNLLQKTCRNGTTALMLAAADNQVEMMRFLLQKEREFGMDAKLLSATRNDGHTVLMVAVSYSHIPAINFLLEKAPALLKKRDKSERSVFSFVTKTENSIIVLQALFSHLESHKRQKGYTDLFREYKNLTVKKQINGITIFDSNNLKRHKESHAWFYNDRIVQFLQYLSKNSTEKLFGKMILNIARSLLFAWKKRGGNINRDTIIKLMKLNQPFRQLFLRFNNKIKPKTNRIHKHQIVRAALVSVDDEEKKTKGKNQSKSLKNNPERIKVPLLIPTDVRKKSSSELVPPKKLEEKLKNLDNDFSFNLKQQSSFGHTQKKSTMNFTNPALTYLFGSFTREESEKLLRQDNPNVKLPNYYKF